MPIIKKIFGPMLILLFFITVLPGNSLWGQNQNDEKDLISSVSRQADTDVGIIVPPIPPIPIPILTNYPIKLYMAWNVGTDAFVYVKVIGTAKDAKTVGALCKGIDDQYFFVHLKEITDVPIPRNYANFYGQLHHVRTFWLYYIKNNDTAVWDTNNDKGYSLNPAINDCIIDGNISLIDMKVYSGNIVIASNSKQSTKSTYLTIDLRIKKLGRSLAKSKVYYQLGNQYGTLSPYESYDSEYPGLEVHHFQTPVLTSSETQYLIWPYFETSDGTYFDWFYTINNITGEEILHYYDNGVID